MLIARYVSTDTRNAFPPKKKRSAIFHVSLRKIKLKLSHARITLSLCMLNVSTFPAYFSTIFFYSFVSFVDCTWIGLISITYTCFKCASLWQRILPILITENAKNILHSLRLKYFYVSLVHSSSNCFVLQTESQTKTELFFFCSEHPLSTIITLHGNYCSYS